ncbi:unnamed protein product [Gongylonema pulchrum]|uniref:BRICHOS domain-containing protein n=1 Tax=Gongylonema pulchrum TaxID=637853 RepID=A0A183DTE3_9BILA|nr:unnamed protein product [Gongylonema pulchrum]
MDFSEKSSPSSTPRSVRAYHRGNGTLRGGGIQKVYGTGPTFKTYKHKLDRRLGHCVIGCLIKIAAVLIIFGLFHETAHEGLLQYIDSTRQKIIDSLPAPISLPLALSTMASDTTATTTATIEETIAFTGSTVFAIKGQKLVLDNEQLDDLPDNEKWTTTIAVQTEESTVKQEEQILSFPYSEPDTCLGSLEVDSKRCLVVAELDQYHNILLSV